MDRLGLSNAIGETLVSLQAMGDNPDARRVVTDGLYRLQRAVQRSRSVPDAVRTELDAAVTALQDQNRPDAAAASLERALRVD